MEANGSNQKNSITVEFEKGNGKCDGGKEKAKIWKEKDSIRFRGVAICPNPCYNLTLSYSLTNDYIELTVEKKPSNQICVQCIGRIPFKGKLYGISFTGTELSLKIESKELAHKTF